MSLISDTDYLIHRLRLSYLRDVQDPYGPRLITIDPSYQHNPYITASSLADVEQWPELCAPVSPNVSEDEEDRPIGFPGARGLKYTQTIMGRRSGGLGLRVSGKRTSTSKRMSVTPRPPAVREALSSSIPTFNAPAKPTIEETAAESHDDSPAGPSQQRIDVQVQEPTPGPAPPPVSVAPFIPKFKGAAEMEARRRIRIAARKGAAIGAVPPPPPPPPPQNLSFDMSSDEEASAEEAESSSDEFDIVEGDASLDDEDVFDPEFVGETRTPVMDDSASDMLSVFSSGSIPSVSASSAPVSVNKPSAGRLSPVSEGGDAGDSGGAYFEMLTPSPSARSAQEQPQAQGKQRRRRSATEPIKASEPPVLSFIRKPVTPIKPMRSALTSRLAAADSSTNPFSELYAAISGRGESDAALTVRVFFPHAREPAGKPMDLCVRRDATVEEALGFALWSYWEEGWLPRLDEGLSGEDDPKWPIRMSAVGWIMRIAEDDGEIDDDFPPPGQERQVIRFNADAYAVMEATPTQVQQNQEVARKIQRRPSRITAVNRTPPPGLLNLPTLQQSNISMQGPGSVTISGLGGLPASTIGSLPLSMSLGASVRGPQVFLRIRVAEAADAVHISTTIQASAGMYMQEVLELICRKRKLADPRDYALLLGDMSLLIPLDRTVASLQGTRELVLVRKSMLPQLGDDVLKGTGKTTDPNASIFKRMSDTPEMQFSGEFDYTTAYKKYVIYRKMPMLVARQERTLAIDGGYVHIMPSANKPKAVFDSGRTTSYHIKNIVDCQQSGKASSVFKLVLNQAGGKKRYYFEADSPKLAAEIVATIKNLKTALDRSGTVNKSRRSRLAG
ncbi:hypothetical protein FISHEDRAFT_76934 [Fistulina hepatica ATCC 64428]|uniref:SIN1-domain-containing protein n=1 Tax=Fistulina hepatica ATCC 64428 TaxID=1128425 RepID=A0A0D7A3Y2_9AGAR|nr:hypothetical protein FISHEDRAFT_76934 [Fistulina hepatica ATCC 64428]